MTERAWANLFVAGNWLLGLGLGGLVLLALHYVTGARWSAPLRRALEAMIFVLPVGAIVTLVVVLGHPTLWPAASATEGGPPSATQTPLHRLWMNGTFFLARSVAYALIWTAFAISLVRASRRQDTEQDPDRKAELCGRNRRLSALFLVDFGITCWLAS